MIQTPGKCIFLRMTVCDGHNDGSLHVTGKDGGNGSSGYAQFREKEFSINQEIVKGKVHQHRDNSCLHRQNRFATFPQCAGIHLTYQKCRKSKEHHIQIPTSIGKNSCSVSSFPFAVQIKLNQIRTGSEKQYDGSGRQQNCKPQFKAERLTDSFCITLTIKLCSENPGT